MSEGFDSEVITFLLGCLLRQDTDSVTLFSNSVD